MAAQQYMRHTGNAIDALDRGDIEIVRRQIKLAQLAARKRIQAKQQAGRVLSIVETTVETTTVIEDTSADTLPLVSPPPRLVVAPVALTKVHSTLLPAIARATIPLNNPGTQFYVLLLGWGLASAVLVNTAQYLPTLPTYNSSSQATHSGVNADLMRVYNRAAAIAQQQGYTIHIRQGVRTKAEQIRYVANGASRTLNSRHLTGDALDLEVKYAGKSTDQQDWYWVRRINTAMQQASAETGVPIEWGGNWKTFKDGFHFQLPWSYHRKSGGTQTADPTTYDALILQSAREFKIDPLLVKSVIWKESTFNPIASSGKAYGLMQLIPTTGQMLAQRLEMPSPDLNDPATNIRLGTAYLADLMSQFGKLELALAAYNAGPTAVSQHNGIPPYSETRDYVKKITAHYNNLIKNRG
jgi:hypothetical protein